MQDDVPRVDPFEEARLKKLEEEYRAQRAAFREQMEAMQRQMQEQMDALRVQGEQQLAQIQAEAEKIKAHRAEKERLARIEREKNKPVHMTVLGLIDYKQVYMQLDTIREDVLQLMKDTPSRTFSYNKNYFAIKDWSEFLEKYEALPNTSYGYYEDRILVRINEILEHPTWAVQGTHDGKIRAKPRVDVRKGVFSENILSAEWNYEDLAYYVPKSEAWRISNLFDKPEFEGAMLTEEVQILIVEQIAKRARLDKIARKLDNDERAEPQYQITLNGWKLRPFQELSLEFLDATDGRALLAHEMGLGKTWISIAYAIFKEFKQTVIICPASLKPNWAREIERLTGERPCVLKGKVPSQWDIKWLIENKPRFILINYDIVGARINIKDPANPENKKAAFLWAEVLNMLEPDMFILDEAHYIKNTSRNRSQACRKLKAPYMLPMTGTPVVNRPGEYWPPLHMIDPVLFPYYERFIQNYTDNGRGARNVEQLREMLRPIMLRYTHKQVQKDLPPINRMRKYHELSPDAVQRYEDVLDGVYRMLEVFDPRGVGGEDSLVVNILAEITRLKQICAGDQCESTAELARELFDSSDAGPSEQLELQGTTDESAKAGTVNDATDANEAGPIRKVIVFSKFKATAYRIHQLLGSESICTVEKTSSGFDTVSVDERMSRVDRFQSDPNVHFIVTTIGAAAEGLTMTAGYYVIFNDLDWTPKAHKQAEGRARGRLNDSHNIDSYMVIAEKPDGHKDGKETIMHWLLDLLGFKESVFEETVEGVEGSRSDDESVAMALIKKLKEQMMKRRAA